MFPRGVSSNLSGAGVKNPAAGNNVLRGLDNAVAPEVGENAERFERFRGKLSEERLQPRQFIRVDGKVLEIRHDDALNAVKPKTEIVSDALKESWGTGDEINANERAAPAVEVFSRTSRKGIDARRVDQCIHAPAKACGNVECRRNDEGARSASALEAGIILGIQILGERQKCSRCFAASAMSADQMRVTRAEFAQKQSLSRQERRPVPFLKLLLKKISQMEFREVHDVSNFEPPPAENPFRPLTGSE